MFDDTGESIVYIALIIWEKQILAPRGMKGPCHQAHPILVGQEMLDFKAWTEGKSKLTIELEKCFQNQASNICPIKNALKKIKKNKNALIHLIFYYNGILTVSKNMLSKGILRAAYLLSWNICYNLMLLVIWSSKHRIKILIKSHIFKYLNPEHHRNNSVLITLISC